MKYAVLKCKIWTFGAMSQWLTALSDFPGDPGTIPSTHIAVHTADSNPHGDIHTSKNINAPPKKS